MKAGSGISQLTDPVKRVNEASDLAMGQARIVRAHTALVFTQAQEKEEYRDMLSAVRKVTGAENILGACANGVFSMEGELNSGPSCAVMVFHSESSQFSPRSILCRRGQGFNPPLSQESYQDFPSLMVLGDPGFFDLDAYNKIFQQTHTEIFGGGASSSSQNKYEAPIFYQEDCLRQASCGLAFPNELKLSLNVIYGCRAVCAPIAVTKTKRNLILELSGKPAIDMLEKTLSRVISESDSRKHLHDANKPIPLLAGVLKGFPTKNTPPAPAEFYVRPIMAIDPPSGGIVLGESLQEGSYLTFAIREKSSAHRELEESLRRLKNKIGRASPYFGFYFSCANSENDLREDDERSEMDIIRDHLGHFPLAGMPSSFGIVTQGSQLAVQNFTDVLAVFSS